MGSRRRANPSVEPGNAQAVRRRQLNRDIKPFARSANNIAHACRIFAVGSCGYADNDIVDAVAVLDLCSCVHSSAKMR